MEDSLKLTIDAGFVFVNRKMLNDDPANLEQILCEQRAETEVSSYHRYKKNTRALNQFIRSIRNSVRIGVYIRTLYKQST